MELKQLCDKVIIGLLQFHFQGYCSVVLLQYFHKVVINHGEKVVTTLYNLEFFVCGVKLSVQYSQQLAQTFPYTINYLTHTYNIAYSSKQCYSLVALWYNYCTLSDVMYITNKLIYL